MRTLLLPCLLFLSAPVLAEDPPLRPDYRAIPGAEPTPFLRYQNPATTSVVAAGSWDRWSGRHPLELVSGIWTLDTRTLPAAFGQHEFKFIVNGEWESGENRACYINPQGELERPSELIFGATIDDRNEVNVTFRRAVRESDQTRVYLVPPAPIRESRFASGRDAAIQQGYFIAGGLITFVFDEATYGLTLSAADRVAAAGNFSGWDGGGGGGRWALRRSPDGTWDLTTQLAGLRQPQGEKDLLFKFVINGQRWMTPPADAANAVNDGKGNLNLRIDPQSVGGIGLKVLTEEPLDLSQSYMVVIDGIGDRPVWAPLNPGKVFDKFLSQKELGAILDRGRGCTTYRIFAPRASAVRLAIYDQPAYETYEPEYRRFGPVESFPLWKDEEDGVWEITLLGLDAGKYYSFNIEGPSGNGESFNGLAQVGDPYGRAAAHARNNNIVIDPLETNRWFGGWTDSAYAPAPIRDVLLYECHVRGMTIHPSSGVPPELRGTYAGLLATLGTGTGLDHLKDLGVTTIELLPTAEFNGDPKSYSWGYAPVFYFAPEASYARRPLEGSQYFEFKGLVDGLHNAGFGVVLDVVFNHVGSPNVFNLVDKKYFFRLNPDYTYSNFSGCGNDVRTESLMMRRLIVDNILYWMKEFHVDGFRFDLAELVDLDTLMAVRDAARALNPNVLLISEPWSFRGENKHQLKGTGWSAWNNDFRYASKDFASGRRNRDWLQKNIFGSVDTWAANPLQPVNYLESHDDMALADEFCTRPDRDGRNLQEVDVAVNRLAATVLFTSLGIPMIHEGQEFLRSKFGIHNTFDKGDAVNAVQWTDRDRPLAAEALGYYRGLMRLRGSAPGAAFRVAERPPANYYQWILPADPQALGYIVNAPRAHEGNSFVVLLNSSASPVTFNVPFPAGNWRQIGDGITVNPLGVEGAETLAGAGARAIQVPPIRAFLFMDGF